MDPADLADAADVRKNPPNPKSAEFTLANPPNPKSAEFILVLGENEFRGLQREILFEECNVEKAVIYNLFIVLTDTFRRSLRLNRQPRAKNLSFHS